MCEAPQKEAVNGAISQKRSREEPYLKTICCVLPSKSTREVLYQHFQKILGWAAISFFLDKGQEHYQQKNTSPNGLTDERFLILIWRVQILGLQSKWMSMCRVLPKVVGKTLEDDAVNGTFSLRNPKKFHLLFCWVFYVVFLSVLKGALRCAQANILSFFLNKRNCFYKKKISFTHTLSCEVPKALACTLGLLP